jgi:exodeoxyribonuclease VII large subunit
VDTRFTLGELERKKQETIKRLLAECPDYIRMVGERIVTRNQGHVLKLALQRIAVVGSRQSAGYQDFVHTLKQNPYGYVFDVDTYHTSVQGEDKANEVLDQLLNVFRSGKNHDLVVIIRGGGAESDFLIFNDFNLNRAIAKFPIPVITGIGHLKDQSIADLMAHTETKTPTKAAEFIITHNKIFEDQLLQIQKNLLIKAQQIFSSRQRLLTNLNTVVVNKSRDYLQHYAQEMVRIHRIVTQNSMQVLHGRRNEMVSLSGRVIAQPRVTVAKKMHELEQTLANISTFRNQFLKNQRGYLQHYVSWLRMASPENTLKRGFAIVKKESRIVTDAGELAKGDEITVVLHHSELTSTIKEIKQTDGSADNI